MLFFLLFIQSETPPRGWCRPHARWVFPSSKPLWKLAQLEMCLLGVSKNPLKLILEINHPTPEGSGGNDVNLLQYFVYLAQCSITKA